eukprot:TRINITY_DN5235_c0_g1_i2.p2 TRINITY_DN5235_c0_g1~~TRINITY_DN5235_c0_g1_i2.p2  ORF type:complete len:137 (+),score=14.06 TRINITY_DN5235_c0_g1_i2:292-702(+)
MKNVTTALGDEDPTKSNGKLSSTQLLPFLNTNLFSVSVIPFTLLDPKARVLKCFLGAAFALHSSWLNSLRKFNARRFETRSFLQSDGFGMHNPLIPSALLRSFQMHAAWDSNLMRANLFVDKDAIFDNIRIDRAVL